MLDRRVRERIALWEGSKGALLEEIMGERDAIGDSDQGKSFRAFWDFLMSGTRQDEFTKGLAHVLALPAVADMKPDGRTARVHYDWLRLPQNDDLPQNRTGDGRFSGLVSVSASCRLSHRRLARVTWNRMVTRYDRDADIIEAGVGVRF